MKTTNQKVLHVIGNSEFGGAVWIIMSYVKILQAHGLECVINTSNDSIAELFTGEGCEILSVKEMRREINPFYDAVATGKLAKACRDMDIDIVHTHTSKGGFVGRAAAKIARVPIIIHTVHGFAFHEFSPPGTIRAYSMLERMASHWCDKITTVSEFHRNLAIESRIAAPEKLVTVYNGVSPERLKPKKSSDQVRSELGYSQNDLLLGAFGRLAAEKGIDTLIESMVNIVQEQPRTRLVIVGDGPERTALSSLVDASGLKDRIMFTGFRSDIPDILNACDVVVSASIREGLSISIMEAMAMAKAQVVTSISSNQELVKNDHSGIVIPPNDSAALAAGVLKLLSDKKTAELYGSNGREIFMEQFQEEVMQQRIWDVYARLIDKKSNLMNK